MHEFCIDACSSDLNTLLGEKDTARIKVKTNTKRQLI
jgi:hypothetical protein